MNNHETVLLLQFKFYKMIKVNISELPIIRIKICLYVHNIIESFIYMNP